MKSLVVSVRIKPTTLATLVRFVQQHGQSVANRGQVIAAVLEQKVDEIQEVFGTSFQTESDALAFLESNDLLGDSKLNRKRVFRIRSNESQVSVSTETTPKDKEGEYNQLDMFREIVNNLVEIGEVPTKHQLGLAQMVLDRDGHLIPIENIDQQVCLPPEDLNDDTAGDIAGPTPNV